MADLSNFLNGGNAYRIKSLATGVISSGNTGTLLNITATGTDLVNFIVLGCVSTANQPDISFTVDGVTLVTGAVGSASEEAFTGTIGINHARGNTVGSNDNTTFFTNLLGTNVQILKGAGNTTTDMRWAYHILEKI